MKFIENTSLKIAVSGICAFGFVFPVAAQNVSAQTALDLTVMQTPVDTRVPVDQQSPVPNTSAGTSRPGVGGVFGWSSGPNGNAGQAQNQGGIQGNNSPTTNPSAPQPQVAQPQVAQAQGAIDPITGNPISTPRTAGGVGGAGASLSALTGRVGLSYASIPNYFGANEGRNPLALFIDATFGANGFMNNEDGLGFHLLTLGNLESKVSINAAYGQIFEGKTNGLDAIEAYGVLETDVGFRGSNSALELELGLPLSGPDGWTLTAQGALELPFGDLGGFDAQLGLTYASGDWMQSYYGITASEASASGLSVYNPGGGLRDISLSTSVDIPFNLSWGLDLGAGARRLLGEAADAPHVKDAGAATDFFGHLAFYYRF